MFHLYSLDFIINSMSLSNNCLQVGQQAPSFTATAVYDQEFKLIKSSDYIGKYVVLFFYPLDFTFVCPTEIIAFSDLYNEFVQINTEVLAVSVDSEYAHLAWLQTQREDGGLGDINFPLISDLTKSISDAYNVLTIEGKALRGLFIIDRQGILQHSVVNNFDVGRNVNEVLRTLKAIQYVQSHPDEVCPANWHPGDSTMVSDPIRSKGYFKSI